jgi:CRP/FNR family cyclic AMP-dependent transcriptional regulator
MSIEVPARLGAAWSQSFLARIPDEAARALLAAAWESQVAAGDTIARELYKPGPAHLMLVLAGLVRVYRTSPEGRQVTLRHARTGDVVGVPSVVADISPAGVQAVTLCHVLHLPIDVFRHHGRREPQMAWAMAQEMSRSLFGIQERMAHNVFASMRGRVARELVDVAQPVGRELIVHASHQDLADALASVREVVGRILGAFRDEGLVERRGSSVVLLDPEKLMQIASDEAMLAWSHTSYSDFQTRLG